MKFYHECYEFLKKRVMALGASEEEFKEGIRMPDFSCNSMEDVMMVYACIAQDYSPVSKFIKFKEREEQIWKCLFHGNIDKILSEYSSSDELEKRFVEEFKLDKQHKKLEEYAASIYGFCELIEKLGLLEFDKFVHHIQEHSQTLKDRLNLISHLDQIEGVGVAVAANFLKELGLPKEQELKDSYSLYSKPDRHMLDIMHGCGFIKYRDAQECFIAVDNLSDELNKLCEKPDRVSPYTIDKVFYCAKSGNYYKFKSIKTFEEQFAEYFQNVPCGTLE